MAKRVKKLMRSIESFKLEIEKHFEKLQKDIEEKNEILARYHIKEIDRSLINSLEHKINLLGKDIEEAEMIKNYKKRLEEFKEKIGIE